MIEIDRFSRSLMGVLTIWIPLGLGCQKAKPVTGTDDRSVQGEAPSDPQGKNKDHSTTKPSSPIPKSPGDDSLPPSSGSGIDPSMGKGGTITNGQSKTISSGGVIYIPKNYSVEKASAVLFLFNMSLSQWQTIADTESLILVNTVSYNDENLIFSRVDEAIQILEEQYNVDKARYYYAGWSAGGNIILLDTTDPAYNHPVAGIMVFPGSGGNFTKNNFKLAAQQKKRAIPVYYAVGDQDTGTGYYPGVLEEAGIFAKIAGYKDRIQTKVWPNMGHSLNLASRQEAWKWLKAFNSKTN